MTEHSDLLDSIATTIADYREGEVPKPDAAHVDLWVKQFEPSVQLPILKETAHVLAKTYVTRKAMEDFARELVRNQKLTGGKPKSFWRATKFLDVQTSGNSQRELLDLMDEMLLNELGFGIDACGSTPTRYVYLDDGLFTGNRVRNDLLGWLKSFESSVDIELHVVSYAQHTGGQYYARTSIEAAAAAGGLKLDSTWWRVLELQDQRASINASDVLRPRSIPDDPDVKEYVDAMAYKPVLRTLDSIGKAKLFSTEGGRALLEQEFMKAGVHIRKQSPYLNDYQRPLGNMVLETLGFGTMVVTYRNCPNNAPLALWAGDPWHPLFPRRTNVPKAAGFDIKAFLNP